MNRNILSALGTLMVLSTVDGATLLPEGRSDSVIYKQDWLRVSVQKAKAEAMSPISLNVIIPLHPKVAIILPRPGHR
jgi:hypothetical protein